MSDAAAQNVAIGRSGHFPAMQHSDRYRSEAAIAPDL
jgi:hypothetical protein